MTETPYNGVMFAHDLIAALDRAERYSRRGRPHFNEKRWFQCLEEADQHDSARAWKAKCNARDAQDYPASRVRCYEHLAETPSDV